MRSTSVWSGARRALCARRVLSWEGQETPRARLMQPRPGEQRHEATYAEEGSGVLVGVRVGFGIPSGGRVIRGGRGGFGVGVGVVVGGGDLFVGGAFEGE
jgi:hypothetical protein